MVKEIDRHYAHWLSVREDLFEENEMGTVKEILISPKVITLGIIAFSLMFLLTFGGADPQTKFQKLTSETLSIDPTTFRTLESAYIPFKFWFCCNPGLALPIIVNLQYHEVKVNMTISKKDDLSKQYHNTLKNADDPPLEFGINNSDFKNFKLYAEYVYLDTDERRRFSQMNLMNI